MTFARVALFAGDGIGPEVIAEARQCVDPCAAACGLRIEWTAGLVGGGAIDRDGTALPADALRLAMESDAILLGAVGGPRWDDLGGDVRPEQALLAMRRDLELFANLRPVRTPPPLVQAGPLRAEVITGTDILFVRELTGGIYYGRPSERRLGRFGREAIDTVVYTEGEIARVARTAFDLARDRRRHVTSVDKANILASSRLWREVVHEVARAFPDVACDDVLIDAMSMHVLRRPRDFDVVVAENMFGDILTDEASVLAGSLGMLPSASLGGGRNDLGERRGLYEPVHGSAPDIAGADLANPLAAILSGALMLRYSLGKPNAAAVIEAAVDEVLVGGWRTADLQQPGTCVVGCREMGALVRQRIEERLA